VHSVHFKDRSSLIYSKNYQLITRALKRKKNGPIKIWIICNSGSEIGCQSSAGSDLECETEADELKCIPTNVATSEIQK